MSGGTDDRGGTSGRRRAGRSGSGGARKARPEAKGSASERRRGRSQPKPSFDGLVARDLAVAVLALALDDGRSLDDALGLALARLPVPDARGLEPRDRAFARAIAMAVLRRRGQLYDLVGRFLERGPPRNAGGLTHILNAAAAQLVCLDSPAHAVIHLAVEQVKRDPAARRFDKLANAVLRRIAEDGPRIVASQDAIALNMPRWLMSRWEMAYGQELARAIAAASLAEPPLDLAVKSDAARWAAQLGGTVLPTGAVRLAGGGRVEDLAGYAEGAWWVQDAAAQLPVRLFGDVKGLRVADLCAAPGGKTAELSAAGARVTAVDRSGPRLGLVRANLTRLGLSAEVVEADVLGFNADAPFDAVLLDAPCSATGTIRRHPDILAMKHRADVTRMAEEQARLLAAALELVRPGGTLVYCVCSLEPEEGPDQVAAALARNANFVRRPVTAGEAGIDAAWITPAGDLRTLPCHLAGEGGMDGFYAARLDRRAD